jgi:cell division transport system permease protein
VEPKDKTADTITALSDLYKTKPGVKQVVSATDTIKLVQKFSQFLTKVILLVAVSLLGVAILLIMNTIRMAMYARRREIEVMKLVGATNWFIRVPFMAEGLVQGIFGVALSVGLLVVVRPWFQTVLPSSTEFPIFSDLVPASTDMLPIYLLMTVLGCLIGAGGAGIAVTRFLDV